MAFYVILRCMYLKPVNFKSIKIRVHLLNEQLLFLSQVRNSKPPIETRKLGSSQPVIQDNAYKPQGCKYFLLLKLYVKSDVTICCHKRVLLHF